MLGGVSIALLTDRYELTMVAAARQAGIAERACTFEVFGRSLPPGRRYGVFAGTGRLLPMLAGLRFDPADVAALVDAAVVDDDLAGWLGDFSFTGDVDGLSEGEVWFPNTPLLSVRGSFAECVVLETLVLSVLNHDCAIAAAASRMVTAAGGRPMIEMGGRRTHEEAAVAAARAAYLAGFATTSNLEAGRRHGIPTAGTSAHAFTLLADDEEAAFAAQVQTLGPGTTLLVDTYDVAQGVERAVRIAGTGLGAVRIDSGDLGELAHEVRAQLDGLGARGTRIVVTGDLDEFAIASLAAAPVDSYGVGTSLVTGSGAPTAGLVYKLVEVAGRPVAKKSAHKATRAGAGTVFRSLDAGHAVADVVLPLGSEVPANARELSHSLIRGGEVVADLSLASARKRLEAGRGELGREALVASRGAVAIPTLLEGWPS